MNISKKHRSWLLGGALLLTIAATAAVNNQDDGDIGVVHRVALKPKESISSEPKPAAPNQGQEHLSFSDMTSVSLVGQLKRQALPESVKDMFPSKSWYVPPPPPKILASPVPTAPPLDYLFIGKMIEAGNSAVFLENRSRIFIVHEGDTIDSKYRVDSIDPPLMTLTYLPLNIKQTVQIGEAN